MAACHNDPEGPFDWVALSRQKDTIEWGQAARHHEFCRCFKVSDFINLINEETKRCQGRNGAQFYRILGGIREFDGTISYLITCAKNAGETLPSGLVFEGLEDARRSTQNLVYPLLTESLKMAFIRNEIPNWKRNLELKIGYPRDSLGYEGLLEKHYLAFCRSSVSMATLEDKEFFDTLLVSEVHDE